MSILWMILFPILGIFIPLLCQSKNRNLHAILTATCPAIAFAILLSFTSEVFNDQVIYFYNDWVPTLGLALSFHLDGLAYLFSLLILGIGLLIILYARYYLSEKENMGKFYSFLMLFMVAMLGVVTSNNLIQLWLFWELTSISSFLLISFR